MSAQARELQKLFDKQNETLALAKAVINQQKELASRTPATLCTQGTEIVSMEAKENRLNQYSGCPAVLTVKLMLGD